MSKIDISNHVTELAKEYGQFFPGIRGKTISLRPKICPFEDVLSEIPENASIFDIGCGSGFFLFLCARVRAAHNLSGVDPNSGLIKMATSVLSKNTPQNTAVSLVASSNMADWPTEQFDIVSMVDVLHHIPKPLKRAFISAAMQRVKPGGKFIYKDMAHKPFIYATGNRLHDLVLARDWISYLPMSDVRAEMQNAGFRMSDVHTRRMLWYAHEMTIGHRD